MKGAYISWAYDEEEACYIIAHLFVPVDDRGKGKGRKLLQDAIQDMREEGLSKSIKVAADSESEDRDNPIDLADLVSFYESEGFDLEYAGEVVILEMSL